MNNVRTRTAAAGFATLALLALGACSSDDSDMSGSEETMTEESPMAEESPMEEDMESEDTESDMAMDPAANLVGPGCEAYAEEVPDGAGSITGMSTDPVAVAASNNPMLTTLTSAVSGELNPDVNLVDTLNGDEFTVFAPVDDAFAAVDAETIDTLSTDADLLTSVLTYHVVPGQILPEDIAGEHETVQGETVEVTGEGDELMVNDANVVCGGVMTQNATVYLVDSVLMPSM
ncbi:putative surface protein with fasciclin (FAS1) repeats [Isoptericola sp. CG 20/1183]|uniref:Surface protein with fasciclin (FAS1) repeats n=1 Tax=Isoptericola halotolerans TaxID=300560 RepID=A0ABX5EFZ2_9MICO|nr:MULTISPECIES: fasciclin domain-containing protein [Isoptericola]MCK0116960.1 fasciclin domain-containing protein [Isoptericola sp. S6320L]PRZ08266.1 putative surface protein with fasciclin (FAS1) repeats [Isoptericola halotolerans]PRZ09063.1 putative surface protein with fasciclin (FAS1) repeats [Isoptericola sp. CG 20/1183]